MTHHNTGAVRPVPATRLPKGRRVVLTMYQRVRWFAVPMWMIEAATERRVAGDVAGACAAANIDLDVDLVDVARACGQETADLVADDLRHLAPDLLRWHVPRVLAPRHGAIWSETGVLRRYPAGGGAVLLVSKAWRNPVRLEVRVRTPRAGMEVVPDRGTQLYHLHRSCWDARYTDELRGRCGGTDRIPFFHADGRPLDTDELPDGPRPGDPVATVEWLTMLWDRGRVREALAACGIDLVSRKRHAWPQVAVERLVADARNVLDHGVPEQPLTGTSRRPEGTVWLDGRDETQVLPAVVLTFDPAGQVTARHRDLPLDEHMVLTVPEYRHPIDFDLLRFGYLQPDDLHPLVARALFPARDPAVDSGPPSAVDHRSTRGDELLECAYHGDTPGVMALLDAGSAPGTRNAAGETLLHLLTHLDHEVLLPRLVAAGVDINTVDAQGHTALHAAAERLSTRRSADDLVDRLIDAGGVDRCPRQGVCAGSRVTRTPPPSEDVTWRSQPPPTGKDLARLRTNAKQGDYLSRVRLARGLYRAGMGSREVLAECFEVVFPDEFFTLAEQLPLAGHEPDDFGYHAWRLAMPPDKGGPDAPSSGPFSAFDDDHPDHVVRERDPDLIPLVKLGNRYTEYGGLTLCYRRTELATGQPAIFGVDNLDPVDGVEPCGASLLTVLREYHAAVVSRLEKLEPGRRLTDHRTALHQLEALIPPTGTRPPNPALPVTSLRERASRGDYRSMSRLARALYATGLGPREVLAECFGVTFPEEFFVIVEADVHDALPGETTNLPWELATPLEPGGPLLRPLPMMWPTERRIFTWDPDLVPLVALYGDERWDHGELGWWAARHGHRVHCYRLSELAAGRSTVFGVPWRRPDDDGELSVEPVGQSLLTVVHEYVSAQLALDEWEVRQPSNWGAGSLDDSDVEGARQIVADVEELQRRLDDRTRRTDR